MEKLIGNMKVQWLQLIKFGVFITGIITILISPPPVSNLNNNIIRFLITVIISFLLIPILLYNKKKHLKKWLMSSISAFIISFSLLIVYNILSSKYVVDYAGGKVIIGSKFTDTALKKIEMLNKEDNELYQDGSEEHNFKLLSYKGGNAESIWDYKSINRNRDLLVSLFYLFISIITILLLCIMQTLQILFSKQQ